MRFRMALKVRGVEAGRHDYYRGWVLKWLGLIKPKSFRQGTEDDLRKFLMQMAGEGKKDWPRKRLRLTRFFLKVVPVFYGYILHSLHDTGLYIGIAGDLRRRLREHQEGKSFATAFRGPWKLIYYEACLEEADAVGLESFLKSGGGRRFLDKQLLNYFARCPRRLRMAPVVSSSIATA